MDKTLEPNADEKAEATEYDRVYGLDPNNAELAAARQKLLDRVAVVEHGITFRYIPAGPFLMGSTTGDADEQPVHRVELDEFWLADTPISWSAYCALMGWEPPPHGLHSENAIRLQYCEDETLRARDWHSHVPGDEPLKKNVFGEPDRADSSRPWTYERKPMVSVSWQDAEALCNHVSNADVLYRPPTEAEWEKAARGGLVNCTYPWGNDPPMERCDFNRFEELSILPMRQFAPNGYGLYAMSGGVWEWTNDFYDASYYAESPTHNPAGPQSAVERVLRGGSWADCAETVTVSFRMSLQSSSEEQAWGRHFAPNIGFRLCRVKRAIGK